MKTKLSSILLAGLSCIWFLATACNSEQPPVQPVQVAPQIPVQPPVAPVAPVAPAAPVEPATDTAPAAAPALVPEPTPTPSTPKKSTGTSTNIDKPLPGKETSGEELIGNYMCAIDSKQLQLGPFKAPPFGCKITPTGDGGLRLSSTSDSSGSIKGTIQNQTDAGFFVNANYEMAGNALKIKARMTVAGPGKYSGSGQSTINDDKSTKISYKLTMTKQ